MISSRRRGKATTLWYLPQKMTSSFQRLFYFEIINLSLSDVFGTFQSLFHCLTKNLDLCVVATSSMDEKCGLDFLVKRIFKV